MDEQTIKDIKTLIDVVADTAWDDIGAVEAANRLGILIGYTKE